MDFYNIVARVERDFIMKKFIKRNRIIVIFGFIALGICVSYAFTYNMPDYLGIEGWYSFLNNVSISYIAALIFYVLQVYKPMCENSRKSLLKMETAFSDLIKFIEIAIACCRNFVRIEENGTISICWTDKDKKILYFIPELQESNEVVHRPAIRKSMDDLLKIDKDYQSKIITIKERIDFKECDPDVLEILSKLEVTDFFKSTLMVILLCENTFITFQDFEKKVNELEKIKDEFKTCCGILNKYSVRNAEDMEIAATEAIYSRKALQSKTIDEFNESSYREFLKIKLKPFFKEEKQLNIQIENILSDVLKKNKKQD